MRRLTAEQRYWQAFRKAHIISRRSIEAMMRGDGPGFSECAMDLERKFIIAEIERTMGDRTAVPPSPPSPETNLNEPIR